MAQGEGQQALEIQGQAVRQQARLSPHPGRIADDLGTLNRIAQRVREIVVAVAEEALRVDGEPAAVAVMQDVVVVDVAVERPLLRRGFEQPGGKGRGGRR